MDTRNGTNNTTVKPVAGGWVSYVDPRQWPKAHFGDTKPYYAPADINTLTGPSGGMIKLPIHLYWGPERWFNLWHKSTLRNAYQMVLEEGSIEDFRQYLNGEVLVAIWDDLNLPYRLSALWKDNVEGLKRG